MLSLILSISIGLFLSLTFFLFSDLIINLTVGDQYLAVSRYIAPYALCMTAFAFVYMVANFFISKEDYKFMYILLLSTILQILSFVFRNESLDMVMLNQYVVYGFMAFSTAIYLIFKLRNKGNGREKGKEEGQ
jgi:Na+-driven multidrug efflux pump